MGERWHRFRFYQGKFSTFDTIERCSRPATCIGCLYHHPLCDEDGHCPPRAERGIEETERGDAGKFTRGGEPGC